jgi:hypothetical protein
MAVVGMGRELPSGVFRGIMLPGEPEHPLADNLHKVSGPSSLHNGLELDVLLKTLSAKLTAHT